MRLLLHINDDMLCIHFYKDSPDFFSQAIVFFNKSEIMGFYMHRDNYLLLI
ncbi:hypothetical protein [Rufibacter quisquiliarum]|uniref:Uncharacterized protein n=1 Tax=Rufibacter quisquiliarum TaxID=1549639 RepID=A0A839GHA4_9BACT|nr:hypothetical protein [Rufibacter quisquiliarum]MBA9079044.1 hypothetical protein [Rufibacter quisquiliarum]